MSGGATYFASDLHLTAVEDPIFDGFLAFLDQVRGDGAVLYLLGDVFEAWIGDDDNSDLARASAQALKSTAAAGVEIAFAHGNRDFLVGEAFAQCAGMRLMAEVESVNLAGERVLLLHGDTLCADDVDYQRVRAQFRELNWQAQFLRQPLAARRAFAQSARAQSAAHTAMTAQQIMDVNADSVRDLLSRYDAHWMIHGHTHRPAVHSLPNRGARIVLGDWPRSPAWLRVEPNGASEFVFDGTRRAFEIGR